MNNNEAVTNNSISKQYVSEDTILACIDGSNVTTSVCDYAAWYGNELGVSISLLHVINEPKTKRHDLSGTIGFDSRLSLMSELAILDEKTAKIANKHGDALLKDAKNHILSTHPDSTVHSYLRRSELLPAIKHYQKSTRMIILGRRGQDHQDDYVNIGSQIETVVRAAHRPIMVCSEDFKQPDSYIVAFDGSPTANKAIDIICENEIAKELKGYLVMVDHQDSAHKTALDEAYEKLTNAGFNISSHVLDSSEYSNNGDVVDVLTHFRKQHDISMFVIGAYGHSKLRQFFVGSTTTKLLTKTTAPIILLR